MPILGVVASSIRVDAGDFDSIATVFGTGSSAVLNITNIPSTYSALQVRFYARTTGSGAADQAVFMGVVSGGTEDFIDVYHYAALTPSTYNSGSGNNYLINSTTGAAPAGKYATGWIDFPGYASTTYAKVASGWTVVPTTNTGYMFNTSGLWTSTATISQLRFTSTNGNWTSDSYFALYGMRS